MDNQTSNTTKGIPGVVTLRCPLSVTDAMTRLEELVKSRGLRVFAKIDFAADAAREGLTMRPMAQLVFGNPKAGTPLLVAAPTIGIDLPLKILAWEDASGVVWLGYRDPTALAQDHQVPAELAKNIAGIRVLAEQIAKPVELAKS